MYTKHPSIDNGTQCEIIKYLATPPPDIATSVFSLTFVVESVDLRYLARFVVSPNKGHAFRITNFESEQEKECLNAIKPSIHEVTCCG
jgi:hypothetical protein